MVTTNKTKLGTLIQLANEPNKKLLLSKKEDVVGVSIDKEFMPSVANLNGTDLSKYCILRKNRFAYNPMHVGRDERLPIALYKKDTPALVSPAYNVFEIKDGSPVVLDYLMLVFKTDLFDKLCWFPTDSSVRGGLSYDDFCNIEINLPTVAEQEKIVNQYNAIVNRIDVLERLNGKFNELMQLNYQNLMKTTVTDEIPLNELLWFQEGPGITKDLFADEGTKFVNIRCIKNNDLILDSTNFISNELAKGKYAHFMLQTGDMLLSSSGTLGKYCIVRSEHLPLCLNTSIIRFRPLLDFDYGFMFCLLTSEEFVEIMYKEATGSAQKNIGPMQLNQMKVKVVSETNRKIFNNKIYPIIQAWNKNKSEIQILKRTIEMILSKL